MRTSTITCALFTAVLLVGGCGSDSQTNDEPVSQVDANGDVDAPNPGGDQTGVDGDVDAPNPGGDQPSADLPGLPIGGQVPDTALTTTEPSGCGTVAWVGPGELIPEGIEVAIMEFDLPDQVSVDDSACAGAGPSCLGGVSFRAGETSCTVGVRWNGETPDTLTISAHGKAWCDDQAACDEFKGQLVTQTAFLSIEVSEPEEEVTTDEGSPEEVAPDDGDSPMTPSVTDTPSDGTE